MVVESVYKERKSYIYLFFLNIRERYQHFLVFNIFFFFARAHKLSASRSVIFSFFFWHLFLHGSDDQWKISKHFFTHSYHLWDKRQKVIAWRNFCLNKYKQIICNIMLPTVKWNITYILVERFLQLEYINDLNWMLFQWNFKKTIIDIEEYKINYGSFYFILSH